MSFSVPTKQITVVYPNEYESAANIIEARIQAFPGHTSRLWDISFYAANKATLDSDHRVLFLGGFDENPAAAAYAKVFDSTEKACGCCYAIAGSKALIYSTDQASESRIRMDGTTHFYSDTAGNTRSSNGQASIESLDSSILQKAALGAVGGWLMDRIRAPKTSTRLEQLEMGCEEFMQKRFASWVGSTSPEA